MNLVINIATIILAGFVLTTAVMGVVDAFNKEDDEDDDTNISE